MPKPILLAAAALAGLAGSGAASAQASSAPPPLAPPPSAHPTAGTSFEAFAAKARERLMALDTDHDGRISAQEFAARPAMHARAAGGSDSADGAAPPRHDGAKLFERLDTNHDGYLDTAELTAMAAKRFARLDADHDQMLTPDERRAMRGAAPGQ